MAAGDDNLYPQNLAENLITVLAYNDEHGKIVAQMLNTAMLDGDMRVIADGLIKYWRDYNQSPGRAHVGDIFEHITSDKNNKRGRAILRILENMHMLSGEMNTRHIMNQVMLQTKTTTLKAAILDSAEKINAGGHEAIGDIEEIWHALLAKREQFFEPPTSLMDYEKTLQKVRENEREFRLGIRVLDRMYVVPSRGKLMTMIAPLGGGKTWFLVNTGAANLDLGLKVFHVSCEMAETDVAERYYMNLFKVTKRDTPKGVPVIKMDMQESRLVDLYQTRYTPEFALDDDAAAQNIRAMIKHFGTRFDNLRIKSWESGTLTVSALESYLDTMEQVDGFVPDMVLIDYPRIMWMNPKVDLRHALGSTYIAIRAMLQRRNIAGVCVHQSNVAGMEAKTIKAQHAGEDVSAGQTADILLTLSASEAENERGLARIFAGKVRGEGDKFTTLITQSYALGQFALESHFVRREEYDNALKSLTGAAQDTADPRPGRDD